MYLFSKISTINTFQFIINYYKYCIIENLTLRMWYNTKIGVCNDINLFDSVKELELHSSVKNEKVSHQPCAWFLYAHENEVFQST